MSEDRRSALVVGFDYYGRYLADLINEHTSWRLHYRSAGRTETARALLDTFRVDAVVSFGGPGPNAAIADLARRRNIPVVVIWAGTDVLAAQANPGLLEIIKNYGFVNVSDGPWLVEELAELGIEAAYVPVTAIEPVARITPLPREFRVLTYLPEPRRAFYGERAVYEIAAAFPEVEFHVVGRGEPNRVAPPNVRFAGYVHDMPARIDASTVLLRLPEHDGKSMLVLEALARARHVIWNYDFPSVNQASDSSQAIHAMRALYDAHREGKLEPNRPGRDYVASHFRRKQLADRFAEVLDSAVRDRPVRRTGKRVAVSGLDLFAAQVVHELDKQPGKWHPEPLRTHSRLEVASSMLSLVNCDLWYSIGAPIGDRRLHLLARLLGKPRVIHWVGSDIAGLRASAGLQRWCRNPRVRHLAEAAWTIAELRALGINAELAPLPPRLSDARVDPLPQTFTVLFYLPRTRGDFYGRREYERLIRTLSPRNVRFFIVGGGDFYAPPRANVYRLGWRTSLARAYAESSVLVRYTAHDGLSLMTLEALAHGRHVLWTQEFPFVTRVRTYEALEQALKRLLEAHERGELQPQCEAARYIATSYSAQQCMERIAAAWDKALDHTPTRPLARVTS